MSRLITVLKLVLLFTVLTGFLYPLLVTGIAWIIFPIKSDGSIIYAGNEPIGSSMIGQKFDSSIYFSSRPSATDYNAMPSGGSNKCITSNELRQLTIQRKNQFLTRNNLDSLTDIPSEMLFASASGLDPHISVKAALLQVDRIAKSRKFDSAQRGKIIEIIDQLREDAPLIIPGDERINVLLLNIKLDSIQ